MEAEIANAEIDSDFFDALAELFRRGQLHKMYTNDYQAVEHLCLFLRLILDNVERDLPKTQRFKINRTHWNVDLVAECKDAERLKDEILESFSLVQRAAYLFLNSNTSPLIKSAKYAVLPILRLPVFSRMFVVPKVALNRDWKLDIVGQTDEIKVALIPIHMLNEPDIIADFVRRILYSGWTSKLQYETWFVTLLGVLCSTPVGKDLNDEDVQKITDQIAASSIAVDALTSMLTQSLLVPHSGDTTNGRFAIKHRQNRDSYLFLQSTNGKYAAISRTQIEGRFEPEMVFVHNIERDQFSQKFYSFGQKSVSTLWSMFSELDKSPTKGSPNRSLDIKLDSFSSLKALFENYFHWCKNDLNNLPLPLLTSMLRSMAVLSDTFTDVELYTSVYAEMRKFLDQRTNTDHPIYGYAIYNLLKCLAVLDLDKVTVNRAEICRLVDTCVQAGLKSTSNFVVFATLHGVLYLIQSVNTDDFNPTLALVFNFLLDEFQRLNSKIDILNSSDAEPVAYHRLLFTVAFRLALHISVDPNPVVKFVSLIRSLFVDPRLPEWLRSSLASGIQTLIMHNASYAETSFRETVVELFDTFQLRPLHFPHALCIYMTSVYRTTQNDKPSSSKQLDNFQSDLQKLLNVFSFYTARKHMERFLPTIAHLMLTLLKMDQIFEMLLSMIPIRARSAKHISSYDRSMLYLLFYVLRDAYTHTQQEIVSFTLKSVFPKVPINDQSSLLMILTNLLIMSALSSDKQTNSLVHVLLRQTQPNAMLLQSCYSQLIAPFKKSAERCGFTLDQRDFPMEPVFDLEGDGSL
ncbi:hypothetical protein M3Y97_00858500 [Aphelenchoides bicaudatus]|nr:hypothetical protein M3Y97_00858500 [Aphelenchoides bicaudatus]